MKQFKGYDEAKKEVAYQGSQKLPAGAYICKISNVRYEEGTDGNSDRIIIAFDVNEGDYKDFFKKQYEANTNEAIPECSIFCIYRGTRCGNFRIFNFPSFNHISDFTEDKANQFVFPFSFIPVPRITGIGFF